MTSTSTYYYNIVSTNIDSLLPELNNKISIDLDLAQANYQSGIFNDITSNIEITFLSALKDYQLTVLNNLVIIMFSNGLIKRDVYVVFKGEHQRCSLHSINPPTINHDIVSGYCVGSKVITTNNEIYTCTNNAKSNATWLKLRTLNENINVYSSIGEISSLGDEISTYDLVLPIPNTYIEVAAPIVTLLSNNSKFSSPQWQLTQDNKLQFIGNEINLYNVSLSLNFSTSNPNSIVKVRLVKNGVPIESTTLTIGISTSENPMIISFCKVVELNTNDYLSIQIADYSQTFSLQTITFHNINLSAKCCESTTF